MKGSPNQRVGVVLLTNMNDHRYSDKNQDIFRLIFNKALKLNEIKPEETNSFATTLMIATILSIVFILRKRKRI